MILDTNALAAIADGNLDAIRQYSKARRAAIPVIVLGEYRFGIALSRRRDAYERWLAQAFDVCEVLPIDEVTSVASAEPRLELRRAATPIPVNDLWIAALCRQHVLPLLSQDRHFDLVAGVSRLSW